ncbi:GNAT family N-acetyltransferase [Bacillus tropicus]|uniref:GNAT family N-acetyltransferase n=2 Tax=Bacillus cereus group TaxID=86661 RepID=A0A5C5A754_9BACI|nr:MULTISPECIES: GNAT family N-acetyltransferase [Bacillus]EEM22900.1 GCN5-related N-acetyltransferase [Bacillus thuringiensis serovar tochigiensis BGSC 4Y1]COF65839.1 GNAT family acetyltransferase [Streptococcus pneumoniae]AAT59683.1 acetyltransferase, GNAT family [[Bacillus thuringiensis] serovar konkukian str. 97-27]AJI33880.1 acetyltransferase domain protein [Bacillus thuringiensis]ALL23549.1 acetyltransferase [Bacillus thuringiensis]
MEIQKKCSLTECEIQQMKDLAHICGQHDQIDYSSDLHVNFLTARNKEEINDFLLYDDTQLVGALSMYDFERPTKLELLGFVHPNYRKQHIGTTLLQTAMKEIRLREADEALLIMNGESASGKAFAIHMKLPYLYSEYSMEFKANEAQKRAKNAIQLTLASSKSLLDLIEISSKAFGDSVENTATWLQKMMDSSSHQVYSALIDEKVIGTITVSKQEQSTTLSGFAVHPSYQGKGYGKDILMSMVHTLITKGASTIELDVETKNNHALKLYTQCGFEMKTKYDYYNVMNFEVNACV